MARETFIMTGLCFLNGNFAPLETARISPMDRGFLFGDGVYEVVPVCGRRFFLWEKHIARMRRSLAGIRLPFDPATLEGDARKVVAAQDFSEQALYIQITRGASPVRAHAISGAESPTVFIAAFPLKSAAETQAAREVGVECVSMNDFRWLRGDLKTTSLLGAVLLASAAKDTGAEESILIRDGLVTEGSSTNILLVKDEKLFTPKFDERVLRGVTCEAVMEVARAQNIPVEERDIHRPELFEADELWLTSSTRDITPIIRLDSHPIANGAPGAMFRQVSPAFQKFKQQNCT